MIARITVLSVFRFVAHFSSLYRPQPKAETCICFSSFARMLCCHNENIELSLFVRGETLNFFTGPRICMLYITLFILLGIKASRVV